MVGLVATTLVTIFVVVMILLFERRRADGIRRDLRDDLRDDLRSDRRRTRDTDEPGPEDGGP